jgi:hypothetical protein
MTNHCGSCTACCKVFAIKEAPVTKPAGVWCHQCNVGKGCKIYDTRPQTCVDFECLWLLSQSRSDAERMGPHLRPDRCKVVFSATTNDQIMSATTMPGAPLAYQRSDVRELIDCMVGGGVAVVVGGPATTTKRMISPLGEKDVHLTPPDADGMQWSIDP